MCGNRRCGPSLSTSTEGVHERLPGKGHLSDPGSRLAAREAGQKSKNLSANGRPVKNLNALAPLWLEGLAEFSLWRRGRLDNRLVARYNAPMEAGAKPAKAEIRTDCLKRRLKLADAEVETRSRRIQQRLIALPAYERAQAIHIYVDAVPNEVKTRDLIRLSLARGKRIAVPWVAANGKAPFRTAQISSLAALVPGPCGLPQPPESEAIWVNDAADRFDLVIVPGVAFDRRGHRIGHGAGFYDRFLSNTEAYKVGIVYRDLLLEDIPNEPHDIPVDAVVTESATHICQTHI